MCQDVLSFWFDEVEPRMWWIADQNFDRRLSERFLPLLTRAMQGELFSWRREPKGRLAEIIVLDQFSRNVFRNTPAAFAQDPMALALAQEAVSAGVLPALSQVECGFLLMPYMHSESRSIHLVAEALFQEWSPAGSYDYELKHKAIIDRFGRYPHRNAVLGRVSTAEEIVFLQQPGSSF